MTQHPDKDIHTGMGGEQLILDYALANGADFTQYNGQMTQHRPYMDWWELSHGDVWPNGTYEQYKIDEWSDFMGMQQDYGVNGGLTPKATYSNGNYTWNNRTKSRWYIPTYIDFLDAPKMLESEAWPFTDSSKFLEGSNKAIDWYAVYPNDYGDDDDDKDVAARGKFRNGWNWSAMAYSTYAPSVYNTLDPDNDYPDGHDKLTMRKINKAVLAQNEQINNGNLGSSAYLKYITDLNLFFL